MAENPKSVFLDADAIIALNVHKHTNYSKAVKIAQQIEDLQLEACTCTYTLLEAATILNMRFLKKRGAQIAEQILENPQIIVIRGDEFLEDGIKVMKKQTSKNISLNDCVYFAIVKKLKIDFVFSFDKHWKKNGFSMLT